MKIQTLCLSPIVLVTLFLVGCGDTTKSALVTEGTPVSAEGGDGHEGHDHRHVICRPARRGQVTQGCTRNTHAHAHTYVQAPQTLSCKQCHIYHQLDCMSARTQGGGGRGGGEGKSRGIPLAAGVGGGFSGSGVSGTVRPAGLPPFHAGEGVFGTLTAAVAPEEL